MDPEAAEGILLTLVHLNNNLGLTILLAEHRLERVLPFVNSLIYLNAKENGVIMGEPRQVLSHIDVASPVIALAKQLGWRPLPLTVQEAKPFAESVHLAVPEPVEADHQEQPVEIALQIADLHVSYESNPALRGVSFTVLAGEILALMGSNGAGKTTLLRSLVGLVKFDEGSIHLFGGPTQNMDTADLSVAIGYLPQDPNSLLFADTVLDELLFTLHARQPHARTRNKIRAAELESVAVAQSTQMLAQMGLADLATAYPRDLSVGQRQRVALAAIMVARPKILLLDEPTRGLDTAAKDQLAQILRTWRDEGHTIILVTHDVELVARLADRVAILDAGCLVAAGKPVDVLSASPVFKSQMQQLFPGAGCLTPQEIVNRLNPPG